MDPFEYIQPNEKSIADIQSVRSAFSTIASLVINTLRDSREKSLVITKLEEASMWANKGILFHQDEQKSPSDGPIIE